MSKFKKGDRVRIVKDLAGEGWVGMTGVVVEPDTGSLFGDESPLIDFSENGQTRPDGFELMTFLWPAEKLELVGEPTTVVYLHDYKNGVRSLIVEHNRKTTELFLNDGLDAEVMLSNESVKHVSAQPENVIYSDTAVKPTIKVGTVIDTPEKAEALKVLDRHWVAVNEDGETAAWDESKWWSHADRLTVVWLSPTEGE